VTAVKRTTTPRGNRVVVTTRLEILFADGMRRPLFDSVKPNAFPGENANMANIQARQRLRLIRRAYSQVFH